MRSILCVLVILLQYMLIPTGAAQDRNPIYYKVTLTIERDGKIIGAPTFVTEPGANAIMANDAAGYSFKADVGSNGGLNTASINISTELYLAKDNKWELFGKPTIFAPVGQESTLSLSKQNLGSILISYKIDLVPNVASNLQSFGKNKCNSVRVAEWRESLSKPVSYMAVQGRPMVCCRFCNGIGRCCSSGPICCSDPQNCGSDSCCNGVPT